MYRLNFLLPVLTTTALVAGRLYPGKCLNTKRSFMKKRRFDPEDYAGTWYEVMRDRFTFFEWTGKCNKHELEWIGNLSKAEQADSLHKGLDISLDPRFDPMFLVTNF